MLAVVTGQGAGIATIEHYNTGLYWVVYSIHYTYSGYSGYSGHDVVYIITLYVALDTNGGTSSGTRCTAEQPKM